jgi:hypothetical protein
MSAFFIPSILLNQVQGAVLKLWTKPLIAVFGAFVLLLPATALAAPFDVKNNASPFIHPSQSGLAPTISGDGPTLIITLAQIPALSLPETRQGNNQSNPVNALAVNNVVLPGSSPCLVASNNIVDFIVTGDFAAGTSNRPWGDIYERYANTSVFLGGKI